jgi:hypothetical protein
VNVTLTLQTLPDASEPGQLLVCEKSPAFGPVVEIEEIVTGTFRTFVKEIVWA